MPRDVLLHCQRRRIQLCFIKPSYATSIQTLFTLVIEINNFKIFEKVQQDSHIFSETQFHDFSTARQNLNPYTGLAHGCPRFRRFGARRPPNFWNLLHINIYIRAPDFGSGPQVFQSGGPKWPPPDKIEFRALHTNKYLCFIPLTQWHI